MIVTFILQFKKMLTQINTYVEILLKKTFTLVLFAIGLWSSKNDHASSHGRLTGRNASGTPSDTWMQTANHYLGQGKHLFILLGKGLQHNAILQCTVGL